MSYSFNVRGADKPTAIAAAEAEIDKMIGYQPIHSRDRAAIVSNLLAAVSLIDENPDRDVTISCNGYLSWTGTGDDMKVTVASVACSVSQADRMLTPGA